MEEFNLLLKSLHDAFQVGVTLHEDGKNIKSYSDLNMDSIFKNEEEILQQLIKHFKKVDYGSYKRYKTLYDLEYLGCSLKNTKETGDFFISIGPFFSELGKKEEVKQFSDSYNKYQYFYQQIPTFTEDKIHSIALILNNLANHPFKDESEELFVSHHVREKLTVTDLATRQEVIEKRYHLQNQLSRAIEIGDVEKTQFYNRNFFDVVEEFKHRIESNPLRAMKNIAIVANTNDRIAAERGGVPPVYLHQLSEKYALLIERCQYTSELEKLTEKMPVDYAKLVKRHLHENLSLNIRKSVEYIELHFQEEVTLEQTATTIGLNPSYLSRKFKEETGKTFKEYVVERKLKEAYLHLKDNTMDITEVALLSGFNDVSYFIKVFKKYYGKTPYQYRKNLPKEEQSLRK